MAARDEGSALLEFCLILPILLVFFFGLSAFALQVIESQMLHFSAYVAARTALVDSASKGEQAAAQFLATSRRELFWLSSLSRQAAGRVLAVTKRQQGVAVQIGRQETMLSSLISWIREALSGGDLWESGVRNNPNRLLIEYRLGRP
ncbi:MAG: pilus assembly protein [Firmicutes bacterium]|nr:pilus assembly protein [Bacillota bacterium]